MERANVRVVQAGDGLRLALEALLQIGVGRDVLGQHLDGDRAIQAGVAGLVHFTHAARAEGGLDFIGAEGGAGFERHGSVDGYARFELLEPVLDENQAIEGVVIARLRGCPRSAPPA